MMIAKQLGLDDGNNNIEDICPRIVATAGDAKSKVYESLSAAAMGDFENAKRLLESAEESLVLARMFQHRLLTKEAQGCGVSVSVLLNHAMDILISAETETRLARYILLIFERTERKTQ